MRPLQPILVGGVTALLTLATALLASCSSGGGTGTTNFKPRNTDQAVAANVEIQVVERQAVYLASEANTDDPTGMNPGTDFTGDGDFTDIVPVVVEMVQNVQDVLPVAAEDVMLVQEEVYVVVDEADDVDWDGDAGTDYLVLLHWSRLAGALTFVDRIDRASTEAAVAVADRIYWATDPAVTMPADGESTLRYADFVAPTLPVTVLHSDTCFGGAMPCTRTPQIIGAEEGILFALLDEAVEGEDLNGDDPGMAGAPDGDVVMALLDTTDPSAQLQSTGLAVNGPDVPVAAHFDSSAADWVVGFLVSEPDTDTLAGGGFNDPNEPVLDDTQGTFTPSQCAADDADLLDHVLHYLTYGPWEADPVGFPPVNTGLAGIDTRASGGHVVITDAPFHVGTIQLEADQAACDLNNDGDVLDPIARFVQVVDPSSTSAVQWVTDELDMHAVAPIAGTPGTGMTWVERNLLIVADEAAGDIDYDLDGLKDKLFLATRDPGSVAVGAWVFEHAGTPGFFIESDWMGRLEDGRHVATFLEIDPLLASNANNGDNDNETDFLPAITSLLGGGDQLGFSFSPRAAMPAAAGVVVAKSFFLHRTGEASDSRDWNGDGDVADTVLIRTTISGGNQGFIAFVAEIHPDETPCVQAGSNGAAFLANEAATGVDYNGDGDTNDFVVRHFRY